MDNYKNYDLIKNIKDKKKISSNLVFTFFDPYLVRTGELYDVIEHITKYGFRVAKFNYKKLKEYDVEQIYRKNAPCFNLNWHIARKIYQIDISCGVIFYRYKDATFNMKKLKGKSKNFFDNNVDETVRGKFQSPNKYISLMHSSDDWNSFLNESLIFFNIGEIEDLIEKTEQKKLDNIYFDKVESSINESYHYQLGFCNIKKFKAFEFLIQLRLRILSRISNSKFCEFEVDEIKKYWYSNLILMSDYSIKDKFNTYSYIIDKEKLFIRELSESIIKKDMISYKRLYMHETSYIDVTILLELLEKLNNIDSYNKIDCEYYFKTTDIFYNGWEEILFETTVSLFVENQKGNAEYEKS